jgi:alpha-tubulin suppressor-like RCC1 family protein
MIMMKAVIRCCLMGLIGMTGALSLTACGGSNNNTVVTAGSTTPSVYSVHSVGIKNNLATTWGYNGQGQLGNATYNNSSVPVSLSGLASIVGISAGASHTLAVDATGKVLAWGYNSNGQLGNATIVINPAPVTVLINNTTPPASLTNITAVSAGGLHSLALDANGGVWAWGSNAYMQLGQGNNSTVDSTYAVKVPDPTTGSQLNNVVAIAAGGGHSLALKNDGTVWAWGNNGYGQLGNNFGNSASTVNSSVPVRVVIDTLNTPLTNVIAIAVGGSFSVAVKTDGTVWTWGNNDSSQLGDRILTGLLGSPNSYAVQIASFGNASGKPQAVSVAGGLSHVLAEDSTGQVYAWGLNANGQLGNGSLTNMAAAVKVTTGPTGIPLDATITKIVAIGNHSLAFGTSHSTGANPRAWSWGGNSYGQLGNNSTTDSTLPVAVTGFQ